MTEAEVRISAEVAEQHLAAKLKDALIAQQAAEIERLQSCGNGAGCLYKESEIERLSALADKWNTECDEFREDNKRLAAEIERLNLKLLSASEGTKDREHAEAYFRQAEKLLTSNEATLHAELDKANTLLRNLGEWIDRGQGSSSEELILFIKEREQLRAAVKQHLGGA